MSGLATAVAGIAQVLAYVYVEREAPALQAKRIVEVLRDLPGGVGGSAWERVKSELLVRPVAVPLSGAALEALSLRVLVTYVHATWSKPPGHLEVITALRQLGVPESWAFVAGEIGPSAIQTGAA